MEFVTNDPMVVDSKTWGENGLTSALTLPFMGPELRCPTCPSFVSGLPE